MNRLMRQSQQERRIAVQLLQARHEKEVICRNRRFQEKRFEQQRLKEFEEALNREAVGVYIEIISAINICVSEFDNSALLMNKM